jgi:rhodanese-related sulfurtransferase
MPRLPWEVAVAGSGRSAVARSAAPVSSSRQERPERPEITTARAAYQWALYGRGVLVDIRPEAQRRDQGLIDPDLPAVTVLPAELNRRLSPFSPQRLGWVTHGARVMLVCEDGGSAALAAAALARLGLAGATHVEGGFRAWRQNGLPVV